MGDNGLLDGVLGDEGLLDGVLGPAPPATVRVEPAVAVPGTHVQLIFVLPTTVLAEVAVLEHLRCEVTYPDGRSLQACARPGNLLEVRLLERGGREFVFDFVAPKALGLYVVRFDLGSLLTLGLPAQATSGLGPFRVVAAAAAPPGSDASSPEPGPGAAAGPTPGPVPGPQEDDAAPAEAGLGDAVRFLVSQLVAGAVVLIAFAARRGAFGGLV